MAKPDWKNLSTFPRVMDIISQGVRDLETYLPSEAVSRIQLYLDQGDELGVTDYISNSVEAAVQSSTYLTLAAWRQLQALYSKNKDLVGTSANARKLAAMEKFVQSEKDCRESNMVLSYYRKNLSDLSLDRQYLVGSIRDIIADVLGDLSHLNLVKMIDGSGFGPGFTFGSTDPEHRHLYYKIGGPHTVTADALPYFKVWAHYWNAWKRSLVAEGSTYEVVRGNRITTVPKTAVIDRTIAIEPSLNVFMQKGVDSYLKSRLRHFGVTLSDQERNHPPARVGSMRPLHAATVDLASASDTVSIEVVRLLFPTDWQVLLDALRSKEYTTDQGNTWVTYEKFSSMGNAFTFPVESIIFYAVAKACTVFAGGNLSVLRVYGDDIVIDPRAALLLTEILQLLGFSVNLDKSFIFGSFRETCGSDFLAGVDLRPVYVRGLPQNDQEVYNLFNRLVHNRVGFQFHSLCEYLHGLVRRPLYGPPSLPPGRNYWRWVAGKSVHYDHYFHAPSSTLERFKRYDPDLQTTVWNIQLLRFVPKRIDVTNYNLQFLYLAFLLGVQGGRVDSNRLFRRKVQYEMISYWPSMPWSPYLYDSV